MVSYNTVAYTFTAWCRLVVITSNGVACCFRQLLGSEAACSSESTHYHNSESYVYWTVHHCDSWRIKRPTWCHLLFYFTSYVLNMFRTLIYPSSGACDYSVELPHWSYCSWFDVCWSFGVVGLEWYPCCRLSWCTEPKLGVYMGMTGGGLTQTEMVALRWSAGISKLDRKTNEYIREKNERTKLGSVQSPLCVWKLEWVRSQTQLCQVICFNEYTRQLHVSACIGHFQVVFKRTSGPTIYIERVRDGEISAYGLCCVICNFYVCMFPIYESFL